MNPTPNFFVRIKNYILAHKFLSLVGLVIIVLVVYFIVKAADKPSTAPTYVIGQATT